VRRYVLARLAGAAGIPLRPAGLFAGHAVVGEYLRASLLDQPGRLGVGVLVGGGHSRVADPRYTASVS
jgi:hypothetical protein